MQLPTEFRDSMVDELEEYLEAVSDHPDVESVAAYLVELVEAFADDEGIDDIAIKLADSGQLDSPLLETLESEMTGNDEFEFTGEEVVSLLERTCGIEWADDDRDDDDYEDEDEDEDEDDDDEL